MPVSLWRMETVSFIFVVVSALFCCATLSQTVEEEVEALNTTGLEEYARLHGFDLVTYHIVTSDDWILQIHRVRNMDIFDSNLSAPVYLSHGYYSSSFDFMVNLRNESLAFLLADRGYDVWLVNYRANLFSNWKSFNGNEQPPEPQDYYRATWQYMADRDVPAVFDYIFQETGQDKMYIVGHSMGNTVLFSFFSEHHEYDDKIIHYVAMAPVLKFGNDTASSLRSELQFAVTAVKWLKFENIFQMIFGRQIPGEAGLRIPSVLMKSSCWILPDVCGFLKSLEDMGGSSNFLNRSHVNQTRIPIFQTKSAGGTTMMIAYQFGLQWQRSPWTKLDFGQITQCGITNMQEYNNEIPPIYNFSDVKVDYSFVYVENDIYTGLDTAREVIKELKIPESKYKFVPGFTHSDVNFAWDSKCWIYDDSILGRFEELENLRSHQRKDFRAKANEYVFNLRMEDYCQSFIKNTNFSSI